jgi:hypothetical protein
MLHFLLNMLNKSPVPEAGTTAPKKSPFSGQLHLYTVGLAVGDVVLCAYGRGRVVQVRSDTQQVAVRLSSWRLTGHSKVTCYLASNDVVVVRLKKISEMSVQDMVGFVQELKEKAAREFAANDYAAALLTSTRAIDAAQYVNRKSGSSSSILQLNVVTLMVACSIRAAACCRKLDQSDEAATIARDALVIISRTLEPKFDGSIRTHVSETDHGYTRVFGEWRVKNLLVLARVSIEQQDYEQALQVLDNARAVSTKYQASKRTQTSPIETSRLRMVSSDDRDDKQIPVTMCEVLCESERKEEELSGASPWIDIDQGDHDAHPVFLETRHAIKRIADLLARETERKRIKRQQLGHGTFGASPRTAEKLIPQAGKSLEEITPLSPPQESSTEQQQEDDLSHSLVESSLCVNIDDGEEKYSDPPPLSLDAKSADDEITGPSEGTKEEQQNYYKVCALPQVNVDEGKKENLDPMSSSLEPKSSIEGTPQPAPQKSLPERQEKDQQANSLSDASLGVKEDNNIDTQPLHLLMGRFVEVSPPRDVPGSPAQANIDEFFDTRPCTLVKGSPVNVLSHPFRWETPERKKAKHQIHFIHLEGTIDEETKDDFDTQPLSLVVGSSVRATAPPFPSKSSPERTEEGHNMLDSLHRVILENEEPVRKESDSQLPSPVVGRAIEVTPPPLRGDSSRERKKFEQRVHLILGVSPRVAVDDVKEEVFDPQAQSRATTRTVKLLSAPFLRREVSPERQTKEQWAPDAPIASPMVAKDEVTKEEFDRQILSVVTE